MRILILEDEIPAVEKLRHLLSEYDPQVQILAALPSVEAAVSWLQAHRAPDLLLADIHLADGLCFDIFQQVPVKCPVIFTTAYDQYALHAFQVHSIDYLLKPVQYVRLAQSLNKLQEMQQALQPAPSSQAMQDIMDIIRKGNSHYKSRFMVKVGSKIKAIKTSEIAYFYACNKLNLLVTHDNLKFPVDYTLDDLMEVLDPRFFFRINRKLIIHFDAAKEIHPYFKGRLKLVLHPPLSEEETIISSDKTPSFKTWLDH